MSLFDTLISELPEEKKSKVYAIVFQHGANVEKMKGLDRRLDHLHDEIYIEVADYDVAYRDACDLFNIELPRDWTDIVSEFIDKIVAALVSRQSPNFEDITRFISEFEEQSSERCLNVRGSLNCEGCKKNVNKSYDYSCYVFYQTIGT